MAVNVNKRCWQALKYKHIHFKIDVDLQFYSCYWYCAILLNAT